MLGEFEYVLITVAAGLGESAYGAAIREEIEKVAGRKCSIGALYTTIERLEQKGMLQTWMGEATAQRGGRAKRMVRVAAVGCEQRGLRGEFALTGRVLWAIGGLASSSARRAWVWQRAL